MKSVMCSENTRLVSLLYELLRDHVSPSVIEHIVLTDEAMSPVLKELSMTNGHLANYAVELAERLLKD